MHGYTTGDERPEGEVAVSERRKTASGAGFWSGVGTCLLVGGAVFGATRLLSPSAPAAPPIERREASALPVETLSVEPTAGYEVQRTFTGEIAARRASEVGFDRGGEVTSILVEEGDRVLSGDALARLDTRSLQARRRQLEAQKARAIAQLEELEAGPRREEIDAARAAVRNLEAELELQRLQRSRREFLYTEGAISQEQRDEFAYGETALAASLAEARSRLEELENGTRPEVIAAQQAAVLEIEANLADLDVSLEKSILRAPFAGTVARREADEGTVVQAGQSVIRLVENSAPEARIGMPTATVRNLQLGGSQTVSIGSETFAATVASILPEIDPDTRTQEVVLELEPAAIAWTSPGQIVRITRTQTVETEGYWLPISALARGTRGLWTCYTIVENSQGSSFEIVEQTVEILHQDGDRALVRGTLQPGDLVVANGTHRLVPGQSVRPL